MQDEGCFAFKAILEKKYIIFFKILDFLPDTLDFLKNECFLKIYIIILNIMVNNLF